MFVLLAGLRSTFEGLSFFRLQETCQNVSFYVSFYGSLTGAKVREEANGSALAKPQCFAASQAFHRSSTEAACEAKCVGDSEASKTSRLARHLFSTKVPSSCITTLSEKHKKKGSDMVANRPF